MQGVPISYRTALIDCLAAMLSRSWLQQRDGLGHQAQTSLILNLETTNETNTPRPVWIKQHANNNVAESLDHQQSTALESSQTECYTPS